MDPSGFEWSEDALVDCLKEMELVLFKSWVEGSEWPAASEGKLALRIRCKTNLIQDL